MCAGLCVRVGRGVGGEGLLVTVTPAIEVCR